jgi:hypothetical protein
MNQQQQEELLSLVALHQQQEQQEDEHEEHHRQLQTTNSSSSGNSSGTTQQQQQQQKNTIDLMDLTDFDVQLALTENLGVQIFEVTDIVTRWMNDAFRICLVNQLSVGENEGSTTGSVVVDGNATAPGIDDYADFDTIILLERNYNNNNNGNGNSRRRLQQSDNEDGDDVNNDEDENADADGNEEEPDEETTSTTTTNRRGEDGEEESEAQGDETTTVDAKDAETVPTTAGTSRSSFCLDSFLLLSPSLYTPPFSSLLTPYLHHTLLSPLLILCVFLLFQIHMLANSTRPPLKAPPCLSDKPTTCPCPTRPFYSANDKPFWKMPCCSLACNNRRRSDSACRLSMSAPLSIPLTA